jgi:imidazole glycerol-phosphate synthase subunit HisH
VSRMKVTVLDYKIGNLLNMVRALEVCGAGVSVVDHARDLTPDCDRMVLPGVGAFGKGMDELRNRGFDDAVRDFARKDRPFLGVCVGMQVLFEVGEEMGEHQGIGLIKGRVRPIPSLSINGESLRLPHIGWRALKPNKDWSGDILEKVAAEQKMYFVHSYAGVVMDSQDQSAYVEYGGLQICAAVRKGYIFGCQFHPERSSEPGLSVLKQFLKV